MLEKRKSVPMIIDDFCQNDYLPVFNMIFHLFKNVSEINAVLSFMQKFKMATKNVEKTIFGKNASCLCGYPGGGVNNFNEITLSRTISEINAFYAEIQDGRQKWQEIDFWEKPPVDSANTLRIKNVDEIALSRTVSEINVF